MLLYCVHKAKKNLCMDCVTNYATLICSCYRLDVLGVQPSSWQMEKYLVVATTKILRWVLGTIRASKPPHVSKQDVTCMFHLPSYTNILTAGSDFINSATHISECPMHNASFKTANFIVSANEKGVELLEAIYSMHLSTSTRMMNKVWKTSFYKYIQAHFRVKMWALQANYRSDPSAEAVMCILLSQHWLIVTL